MANINLVKASLRVSVNAFDKALKEKASVYLRSLAISEKSELTKIELEFNKLHNSFSANNLQSGRYSLQVESKGYEPQQREVSLNSGEQEESFILGRKGMPFFYRGKVQVPFDPLPNLLGIVLKPAGNVGKIPPSLEAEIKKLQLKAFKAHENLANNGLHIYELGKKISNDEKEEIQRILSSHEAVLLCSPILKLLEKNASLLTDNLIVKFKSNITKSQVSSVADEYNMRLIRNIPYAGNAYQFEVSGPVSYRILDICERLVESGNVEYAEPDLWHTVEQDDITPTDWLFPEQWDHRIINTPGAWQVLHDIDVNKTFGDPDVVIALFDTGIDATHPAFSGNLTDGNPKVLQLFDFSNMVPNNSSTAGGHGTCTAGAAAAKANDVVVGVGDGTVGMAGNCKLIGIRTGGTESTFSDAYIWVSGFDPHSPTAGFPATLSKGADIISNSIGVSVGIPISGLMKDTFDYLTAYGRNGKGIIFLFSVGNNVGKINFVTTNWRPWAAYAKTLAIGATTLNNDGVTEGTTTYSNYGSMLDFCAPSHDDYIGAGPQHNPPLHYGAWAPARQGTGNVPGRPTVNTALNGAANSGGGAISVVGSGGLVANQAIIIESPGSLGAEAKNIVAVNPITNQISLGSNDIDGINVAGNASLFNNHQSGHNVIASLANYTNCMGGTSYATPVCAGLCALMLSANPSLTWIDVRQIIRDTAIKIDAANNDAVDRWTDTAGRIATDPGYLGPFFSLGYGYGRIDALAAVIGARDFSFGSDILVRDNLSDAGAVPSSGAFWGSPDIWVRQSDPAIDGVNALPANYLSAPPHEDPDRTHDNWVYLRLKNIGMSASNNFYVRVYVAHWPGTEFTFPGDFTPTNNPGGAIPSPMTPGTYLIGETLINSLNGNTEQIINMRWEAAKIPPDHVLVSGVDVHWHPCLLVQIAPSDGPLATGVHVWDNNNLAQRNVTIVGVTDDIDDFNLALVVGNNNNSTRLLEVEIDQEKIPDGIKLFLQIGDSQAMDWIERNKFEAPLRSEEECSELVFHQNTTVSLLASSQGKTKRIDLTMEKNSKIKLCGCDHKKQTFGTYKVGRYQGRKVVFLEPGKKVRVPILRGNSKLIPVILGGVITSKPRAGTYDVVINQFDYDDVISGSYAVQLRF